MEIITFRSPTGTIAATVSTTTPQVGQPVAITVLGASEAPARVFARMRTAAGPCASNFDADPGAALLLGDRVDGQFQLQASIRRTTPGAYQVCLWLAMASSDPWPIATAQARLFSVVPAAKALGPLPSASCRRSRATSAWRR